MTDLLFALAPVVALAAAARSTWSPCGLSMLSTITPVSERARGSSFGATATWFVLGAVAGGSTLGLVMATLAFGVGTLHLTPVSTELLALGAALVAFVSDSGVARLKLPIHRRQVNERWLDRYRPWAYGAGFGWQIGSGLATYITTAAVYLMIVLAAMTGSPLVALALGASFGLLRGLAVFLTGRIRTPTDLRAFHRRFMAVGPVVNRAVIATEVVVAGVLAASLRSPRSLVIIGLVLALVVVGRLRTAGDPHQDRITAEPDPENGVSGKRRAAVLAATATPIGSPTAGPSGPADLSSR